MSAVASGLGAVGRFLVVAAAGLWLAACSGGHEASEGSAAEADASEDEVIVKTETPEQWAQYQANLRFALDYKPACSSSSTRPRVIVTGYGRFMTNPTNATGLIVSNLVPAAAYPHTTPPAPGEVDEPAPQTSVALSTIDLPRVGKVDVCAMILPVYWDLAAILVLKEVQAFNPSLVLMNGIAGPRQPLWLELGSINRAMNAPDGSNVLAPAEGAPLIPTASSKDRVRPLRMSWAPVKQAALDAIAAEAASVDDEGQRLDDILQGVLYGGFPRLSNTYLCNNVTYTVNYLMGYPGKKVTLLKASKPRAGFPNGIAVKLTRDHRATPRDFVHWPSELSGKNLEAASRVLRSIIDAQLEATLSGDAPTPGDNGIAELVPSGDTY